MLLFYSFNLFLFETFRFIAHYHYVDAWISAGKMSTQEKESNGFDSMKRKKKGEKKELTEGTERERENLKKNKKMSGFVRRER